MEIGLNLNVLPAYRASSWKNFREDEEHVTRVFAEDVLILMTAGVLRFREGGVPVRLSAGEYCIQRRGLLQEGDGACPGAQYYYIHFHGVYAAEEGVLPLRGTVPGDGAAPLIRQLEEARVTGRSEVELAAPFLSLLSLLTRGRGGSVGKRVVSEAALAVSADLRGSHTLDDLSRASGYSKNQLIHIFRAETGTTPGGYVRRIRLEAARRLLTDSALPVGRVAEETGFESYAGFYKAFRRAFGISPEECRRRAAELPPHA